MTSIQTKLKLIASGEDHDYYHGTHMLITVMNLTSVSQQRRILAFLHQNHDSTQMFAELLIGLKAISPNLHVSKRNTVSVHGIIPVL